MAFEITMEQVASYKQPTKLESDKRVTLIYGLNGSGKSTLSNFLYDPTQARFNRCKLNGLNKESIAVYNAKFVRENFHEIDKLNGIFTLSKANKNVEIKIDSESNTLLALQERKEKLLLAISVNSGKLATQKAEAEDATWKIKTRFSGGDRVLEYCLKGLMQAKGRLFEYIATLPTPSAPPERTMVALREEVELIQGENARTYAPVNKFKNDNASVEHHPLFQQPIVGNKDSPISGLIERLGNADWVGQGIRYIEVLQADGDESCPFCQSKTLNNALATLVKNYFDETFDSSVKLLKNLELHYNQHVENQPRLSEIFENPFAQAHKLEIEALHGQLASQWAANQECIARKLQAPSATIHLTDTRPLIEKLNFALSQINHAIDEHNRKINDKERTLGLIKDEFWSICRFEYAPIIEVYNRAALACRDEHIKLTKELNDADKKIGLVTLNLANLQKQTVNVDDAISTINSRLVELGIDSFKIAKFEESRYHISRHGDVGEDFLTLSEGEKTVISFLYFVELCKGKRSPTDTLGTKTVVIDDPISSLSHLYVFNIGQLIKDEFSNSKAFDHVVILTHSLYFFYELADMKKERRDDTQKLIRIIKNSEGSKILDMKYEEVQNDYQAYWNVVMDEQQHPALIANCMRNIIEYFFNFVKKMALSAVFQQPKLKDSKHLAFCRFMNRESHSLGQNIFDIKEFDYARFKEAFKLVFEEAGFPEHYRAMTK